MHTVKPEALGFYRRTLCSAQNPNCWDFGLGGPVARGSLVDWLRPGRDVDCHCGSSLRLDLLDLVGGSGDSEMHHRTRRESRWLAWQR